MIQSRNQEAPRGFCADVPSAKRGRHVEENIDCVGRRNSKCGARLHRCLCAGRVPWRRLSSGRRRWRRVARCRVARCRLARGWRESGLAPRWLGLARSGCRCGRGFGSCQRSCMECQRGLGPELGLEQWLGQRLEQWLGQYLEQWLGQWLGRWMHPLAPGPDWLGLAHCSGERLLEAS